MKDLLPILCCPRCKDDLLAVPNVLVSRAGLKSGLLACRRCEEIVATVRNFKYDFVHFKDSPLFSQLCLADLEAQQPVVLEGYPVDETISFDDKRLHTSGSWRIWEDNYLMTEGEVGTSVTFRGVFTDVSIRLLNSEWSGCAGLYLDGRLVREVDLYQSGWPIVRWYPVAYDLSPGEHELEVRASGRKNEKSRGQQIFVKEVLITRLSASESCKDRRTEINRVLPVFPSVRDLFANVPQDGLILDCGSGDRILDDPRYVSLDWELCQLPMVHGDVLELPFKSETFDLVFSQALLEHVSNPFVAAEEMCRVTRHGGLIWAGMAFMQPVHAVPSHYFNATAWGIQELFKKMEILQVSWFGELSSTVDWLCRASGVVEKASPEEYQLLMEHIRRMDAHVSYEKLQNIASGVAVLARKP